MLILSRSAMKVSTAFEFVQMNKKMDNPFNDPILPVLSTVRKNLVHKRGHELIAHS